MDNFVLNVNNDDLKVLAFALGEIPTKTGMGLFMKITQQVQEQMKNEDKSGGVHEVERPHIN